MRPSKVIITTSVLIIALSSTTLIANEAKGKLNLSIAPNTIIHSLSTTHVFDDKPVFKHKDNVTKNITRAKKAFKKLTSFKLRKNQKVRAILGKSSYSIVYSYAL